MDVLYSDGVKLGKSLKCQSEIFKLLDLIKLEDSNIFLKSLSELQTNLRVDLTEDTLIALTNKNKLEFLDNAYAFMIGVNNGHYSNDLK